MKDKSLTIDGYSIELTNLDKVFFPDPGITKGDLIDYYRKIAGIALPHWQNRPATLQRFPNGIDETGFFQKQTPGHFPDWIDRRSLPTEKGNLDYLLISNPATMVYLANQGATTLHLGLSRVDKPHHPDRMIFDLDPSDGSFSKVQAAAHSIRELLENIGLDSYPQTTGSRGLHILVPLDRSADFETVHDFARRLAQFLADTRPDLLTAEQRIARRGNRVFLDYLRNSYGQTAVAPYSIRPLPEAPVATPLDWHEALANGMSSRKFNHGNIFRRLGQKADPWAGLNRKGRSVGAAVKRLAEFEDGWRPSAE